MAPIVGQWAISVVDFLAAQESIPLPCPHALGSTYKEVGSLPQRPTLAP